MGSPYTSARNGLWDASDVDTWGQGLNVYPQTAADVVNIGHTVTYNKVSTTEMGAITINNGGLLTFLNSMSTKLTLGQADLTVNNGGELRVGANGAVIPYNYMAELVWNPTSNNAKGLSIANGGKLTVYGDPTLYGTMLSTIATQLTMPAQGTTGLSLVVAGDRTAWARTYGGLNQQILVHNGAVYGSQSTDYNKAWALLTVTGASYSAPNTTLTCTVTRYSGATNNIFYVGGDVFAVSRNVMLYALGYQLGAALGDNGPTYKPNWRDSNTASGRVVVSDIQVSGFYNVGYSSDGSITATGANFNGVIRHCYRGYSGSVGATVAGVFYSNYYGCYYLGNGCNVSAYLVNNQNGVGYGYSANFSGNMIGNNTACMISIGSTFNGNIYSNSIALANNINCIFTGCIYWNTYGTYAGSNGGNYNNKLINAALGYDSNNNSKPNTYDLVLNWNSTTILSNVKSSSTPPVFYGRNSLQYGGRLCFEHYNQVANAHYIADAYGDITKVAADGGGSPARPTQRSSGNADVIETVSLSNCATATYLQILNVRLWATAGVSKTYRFYVQSTFTTLLSAGLKLYADYLDQGSGGHLATVSSTQNITTRSNSSDWSQYIEVTVNPSQDGWVNLYLNLMTYESSSVRVWIDPAVVIS